MIKLTVITLFLAIIYPCISMADFNQQYEIKGDVKAITNTEINYKPTKKTVTIDNQKHTVYVDDSNKQYYKIEGKYVPIINTEVNTGK